MTYTCRKCGMNFKRVELAKCGRCQPVEPRPSCDDSTSAFTVVDQAVFALSLSSDCDSSSAGGCSSD